MMLIKLFNERKEQLSKQAIIDNKLKEMNCQCPAIVSEYLLLQRQITRNQQYKVINTNMFYMYDEMHRQLEVNQTITNRFLNVVMSCDELQKIILDK
jgi:hypothetical protein